MRLYNSYVFHHKFSIISYLLLNSRQQIEKLFGLESFQDMKAGDTQTNRGITMIYYFHLEN